MYPRGRRLSGHGLKRAGMCDRGKQIECDRGFVAVRDNRAAETSRSERDTEGLSRSANAKSGGMTIFVDYNGGQGVRAFDIHC
jgi:hypothetical protein